VAGSADRSATVWGSSNRQLSFDVSADVSTALAGDLERVAFRIYSAANARQWIMTPTVRLVLTTRQVSLDPTDITPAGVVGTLKPVFSWSAPSGVTKVHLQVDDSPDFSSPVYDSGELPETTPRVDTSQGPAWAGLAGEMFVRVRHFTEAGWSAWGEATVTYDAPTVFTVSNPGATDADNTPPAVWSPAAEAFEIITFVDGVRKGSTGLVAGPASSFTPTQGPTRAGQVLRRVHRFHDGVARVEPPFAEVVTETTFTPSATVAPLSTFTVSQVGVTPAAQVSWTRGAGVPDEVGMWHGDDLRHRVDGPDAFFTDWTVPPNTDIGFSGSAVVNGEHSADRVGHLFRTKVEGVWLVDPETGRGVVLGDTEGLDISYGGTVVVHTPIDGSVLLRRTLTRRGIEGSITGRLIDWPGRTHEEQVADVEWLAERPERVLRLVLGDLNVPITHSSLQVLFDRDLFFTNRPAHTVSFDFSHAGGF
jgi:hypothetical protein